MARKETVVAQFFGQVSRFIIYGTLLLYFLFQTWVSVDEYTRYRKSRAISQEGKADLVKHPAITICPYHWDNGMLQNDDENGDSIILKSFIDGSIGESNFFIGLDR